ncbi:MAG: hypothetical protein P8170_13690 [Gemmatimonadota bacterium]
MLDLGNAVDSHVRLFGRFSRQVRFAGLLPDPPRGAAWTEALSALPPHPGRAYEVVLAWNVLDYLNAGERVLLVERLAELTSRGARVYVVVDASEKTMLPPLRHTLLDLDRLFQQTVGPPLPVPGGLLPAKVERLLMPFEVVHAFTLRAGLREYVAVRE